MSEAVQWLLLEVGVMVALVPAIIAFMQWRRRSAIEHALRALSQQIKQSEAERKRTLTGILTGAHHMTESRSAEVADSLIRSERTFFRHCFNVMLSQDTDAIEQLGRNLYKALDDYLRKCAADAQRSGPSVKTAVPATAEADTGDVFASLDTQLSMAPAAAAVKSVAEEEEEEVDWNAAFAELDEDEGAAGSKASSSQVQAASPIKEAAAVTEDDLSQEDLDKLLNMLGDGPAAAPQPTAPMEPAVQSEDDIMAEWGAALEEPPAVPPAKQPGGEGDAFDLGWDDAFLEETVRIKPEPKKDS